MATSRFVPLSRMTSLHATLFDGAVARVLRMTGSRRRSIAADTMAAQNAAVAG